MVCAHFLLCVYVCVVVFILVHEGRSKQFIELSDVTNLCVQKRLYCLKPTVQTKQRAAKKNDAAQADATDVLRPTLLCYLVPHLVLSTTIALYRQRAVVSVSLKQVGEVDKQVAADPLHSQIILKMVSEQLEGKRVQFGYV